MINKMENLLKVVKEISADMEKEDSLWKTNKEKFITDTKVEHKDILDRYPAIFDVLFSGKFDDTEMKRLEYMINMAARVEKKDIGEHDASVAVGQRLVDDIVKPQLDEKE